MKTNSKKDLAAFVKRFAIYGMWSIVEDLRTGKSYRVMKKGKKMMQVPIQSLNERHSLKFNFDFDHTIFKYYLSDEELNEVELVLANGEPFTLSEGTSNAN